jgi:hypothetical protein
LTNKSKCGKPINKEIKTMSDKLTKEQETQVEAYYQKMLANGIKTKVKTNRKFAKTAIHTLYTKDLDLPSGPKKIVYVASPEAAIKAASKASGVDPKTLVSEIMYINLWTGGIALYHAGVTILGETSGVEEDLISDLFEYEEITHNIHAILPCENICYVIEYPTVVAIKDNDLEAFKLHREGGLALEYSDGTGFSWLNGVEVPDYVATTSASKLSVKKLMAETNVDVRREGMRRISIDRLLKDTKAKLLDKEKKPKMGKHWDYQLYDMDLGDNKKRVFLRMFDVASKAYTVERVEDTCTTVAEALAWRDGEEAYVAPTVRT